MQTREEYLLGRLAEECVEVAQRALKAQAFGLDDVQEGQPLHNRERLLLEFADLMGIMVMLNLADDVDLGQATKKILKVSRYMEYARGRGRLES